MYKNYIKERIFVSNNRNVLVNNSRASCLCIKRCFQRKEPESKQMIEKPNKTKGQTRCHLLEMVINDNCIHEKGIFQ